MRSPNDIGSTRFHLSLTALLLAITVLAAVDLVLDKPSSWFSGHVLVELLFMAVCLIAAAYLGLGWYKTHRSLSHLEKRMTFDRAERDAWRERAKKLLDGLGEAIDQQMRSWNLTAAERETALLLLKGYSHKEIANLSSKSERTVRQHSVSVYRKAGMSGRAELAAFFLEDLLLPSEDRTAPAQESATAVKGD